MSKLQSHDPLRLTHACTSPLKVTLAACVVSLLRRQVIALHRREFRFLHMRLTTTRNGEHHVTIPDRDALRIETLRSILTDVAAHLGMKRNELAEPLFGAGS